MREIAIREYLAYDEAEVLALYRSVGWTNYTDQPAMLKSAFAHSLMTLAAYDGEVLIGLIRAVGDGHSIVYIQDILVAPQYQRRGIGRALIGRILDRYANVYQKVLLTDRTPETVAFYRSVGFRLAEDVGCAAFFRN